MRNLTATAVLWRLTSYSLVYRYEAFEIFCCFYLQCKWASLFIIFTRLSRWEQETCSMHDNYRTEVPSNSTECRKRGTAQRTAPRFVVAATSPSWPVWRFVSRVKWFSGIPECIGCPLHYVGLGFVLYRVLNSKICTLCLGLYGMLREGFWPLYFYDCVVNISLGTSSVSRTCFSNLSIVATRMHKFCKNVGVSSKF
jgi:hypothetical protein